jgi:HPt (histidine-containing phosphotransfer) domain-containing protein
VGAEALRAVAHRAELACAAGSLQEAQGLAEKLEAELGRLQDELGEKAGGS